jgi:hypothetical protein
MTTSREEMSERNSRGLKSSSGISMRRFRVKMSEK